VDSWDLRTEMERCVNRFVRKQIALWATPAQQRQFTPLLALLKKRYGECDFLDQAFSGSFVALGQSAQDASWWYPVPGKETAG
jgi:hypothetical protein